MPKREREALQAKEVAYLGLWSAQLRLLVAADNDEIVSRIFAGLAILHSVATSNPRSSNETLIGQLVAMAKAGMLADAHGVEADDE